MKNKLPFLANRLRELRESKNLSRYAVAKLAAGLGDLDPAAIVSELRAAIEAIDIRLDIPDA